MRHVYHPRMDLAQPSPLWSVIPALFFLIQVIWYVGITVLLLKIWRKVRHLPG
jgi:hypothetical protein